MWSENGTNLTHFEQLQWQMFRCSVDRCQKYKQKRRMLSRKKKCLFFLELCDYCCSAQMPSHRFFFSVKFSLYDVHFFFFQGGKAISPSTSHVGARLGLTILNGYKNQD